MPTRIVFGVFISLMIVFSAEAMGRSLRCDGRLVKIGDFQHEVVAKCGDPQHVQTYEDFPNEWVSKRYDDDEERFKAPYLLRSPIKREMWTYQRGPNHLPYYLYFHKGRLTRIKIGPLSGGAQGR